MEVPMSNDFPLFLQWLDFLKWLLSTTEKFPKRVRFTFSDRINNLALSVVEDLVEARYTAHKLSGLKKINLTLEKIRILLRIAYETQILPTQAYEQAMKSLNEMGKMLGGWIKQQQPGRNSKHAQAEPFV